MSIPVAFISELATGHLPPMINSNTCVILQSLIIPIETQVSNIFKESYRSRKNEKMFFERWNWRCMFKLSPLKETNFCRWNFYSLVKEAPDRRNFDFFRYITMAPNIANLTGIRTIRVLRALRTISALKGKCRCVAQVTYIVTRCI